MKIDDLIIKFQGKYIISHHQFAKLLVRAEGSQVLSPGVSTLGKCRNTICVLKVRRNSNLTIYLVRYNLQSTLLRDHKMQVFEFAVKDGGTTNANEWTRMNGAG